MRFANALLVTAVCLAASVAPTLADVRIEITGLSPNLEANVEALLRIADFIESEATDDSAAINEGQLRRAHRLADEDIVNALQPFGYYDPLIESSLQRTGDDWLARYSIQPGPPTLVGVVAISVDGDGSEIGAVSEVVSSIALKTGDVLSHTAYQREKNRLFDAAYANGFLDAEYRQAQIRVRRRERQADINLSLFTGPQYYFGEIDIRQDVLSQDFVERFATIRPGDPFNADRLIDLQLALTDSGYFSDVNIAADRALSTDQRIPISVQTAPRQTQRYRIGVGYGTDTGPRIRLGLDLRRINPRGHRFQSDVRLSNIENTFAGEYQIPVQNVASDYVGFNMSLGQEKVGDFDTVQALVGASLNDTWHNLTRRIYVNAHREQFRLGADPRQTERFLYPGIDLSYQRADDPLDTRRGYSLVADLRAGSNTLGSSANFVRFRGAAKLVRPLTARSRFLFRSEIGAINVGDLSRLAPSQRFFTGGDASVRGYSFKGLGPTTAAGQVVGGRYLFVASVEFDYLFRNNFGIAAFVDAGDAANTSKMKLNRAVGLGLRWRSPVGMVRIDLAHPRNDPSTDYRIHLSVGTGL